MNTQSSFGVLPAPFGESPRNHSRLSLRSPRVSSRLALVPPRSSVLFSDSRVSKCLRTGFSTTSKYFKLL